jgi:hypothetical protein
LVATKLHFFEAQKGKTRLSQQIFQAMSPAKYLKKFSKVVHTLKRLRKRFWVCFVRQIFLFRGPKRQDMLIATDFLSDLAGQISQEIF